MGDRLLRSNSTEFFHGLLREAFAKERVDASEKAEFYLVNLLERFIRPDPESFDRPLALDYLEAFGGEPPLRYRKLKSVGDRALFTTGVFLESLERTAVGAEYYASLGGAAYGHLATLPGTPLGAGVAPLFSEMSLRFLDFVRVLAQMSSTEIFAGDRDTLRIYRRWLVTRGARDADLLARRGIIPFAPAKPRLQ